LSNPHRLTLVVRPDPAQEARDAAAEASRLAAMVQTLSGPDQERLLRGARAFKEYQVAPDKADEIARIPSLSRSDIPAEVERIPREDSRTAGGTPLTLHDIFTNEIVYLDLVFPTHALTGELSLLLPLFGRAVTGMGLPGIPYHRVALDLFRLTGGFSASLDAGGIAGKPDEFGQFMFFRTRSLRPFLTEAVDLVARLLSSTDFRDLPRLRDLLLELRNDMKSALIPGGHQFAMLRAASMISESVAKEEEWRGITQLLFLDRISADLDRELPRIAESLENIRSRLLVRPLLAANATAVAAVFPEISAAVDSLAGQLPVSGRLPVSGQLPPSGRPPGSGQLPVAGSGSDGGPSSVSSGGGISTLRGESLVASASVGYVARAMRGFRFEHPLNGPVAVLGHLLSTGYLLEKVRMEVLTGTRTSPPLFAHSETDCASWSPAPWKPRKWTRRSSGPWDVKTARWTPGRRVSCPCSDRCTGSRTRPARPGAPPFCPSTGAASPRQPVSSSSTPRAALPR